MLEKNFELYQPQYDSGNSSCKMNNTFRMGEVLYEYLSKKQYECFSIFVVDMGRRMKLGDCMEKLDTVQSDGTRPLKKATNSKTISPVIPNPLNRGDFLCEQYD